MPLRMPIGIAINDARPTMIALPAMACDTPAFETAGQEGSQGGSSALKKNCGWITEGRPFAMVNQRTNPSGISATTVSAYIRPSHVLLARLRLLFRFMR